MWTVILTALWAIAISFSFILVYYLSGHELLPLIKTNINMKENAPLISGLFILLASGIASVSLMKSISSNEKLKRVEIHNRQKGELLFLIHTLNQIEEAISILYDSYKRDDDYEFVEFTGIKLLLQTIDTWNSIQVDKYFVFLSNNFDEIKGIDRNFKNFKLSVTNNTENKTEIMFAKDLVNIYNDLSIDLKKLIRSSEIAYNRIKRATV